MQVHRHTSLGEQISKKMSAWFLILVAAITAGIFFVSYLLSRQMFNQQVNIWNSLAPQYALTNLIDSDYSSIAREVKFIESTGLFSSFVITDNQKRVIAQFGSDISNFNSIQDQAKVIWGYYSFTPNFYKFFSPFLIAGGIFSALVLLLYFIIRWRMRLGLELEFSRFNQFLKEIELITEKLSEIYSEDESELYVGEQSSYSVEQEMINRAVTKLLDEIRRANRSLREAVTNTEKKRFQEELTRTALQVSHDIGSPLAALETIVQSTSITLPEESRVPIRNAASRIRDITNTLLKKSRSEFSSMNDESLMQHLLFSLINMVITEKRLEFRSKPGIQIRSEFDQSSYGLFSIVRATEFNRVISNIINNSVEALQDKGKILVSLSSTADIILVVIEDNGVGIPKEVLANLGKFGTTYGKRGGSGLGIYHAKNTIESWGGKLEIESVIGKGTLCKILLPKAKLPSWFVPEIKVSDKQKIIIIDDDQSIHDVWKQRFNEFQLNTGKKVMLHHFYSPQEFTKWMDAQGQSSEAVTYLCDYEFIGNEQNGIDLVTTLKINYLSILVTSHIHSDEIISRCESAGIRLLPKDITGIVPIME